MATITGSAAGGAWNTNGAWVGGVQPTAADDVLLTSSSGSISILTATTALCRSLDCTGYTGTLSFITTTSVLTIGDALGGACTFSSGMTLLLTGFGVINFVATTANTTYAFTTAGKLPPYVTVATGATTTISLADNLTTVATVTLNSGKLDTNSKTCAWGAFTSSNSAVRTLTLGSSAITCGISSGATNCWSCATATNLTVTTNTAVVTLNSAVGGFVSGAVNWNGLSLVYTQVGAANVTASGAFTVANLTRTGTAVKTDSLTVSGPFTVTGTLTLTGNSTINRMRLQSSVIGTSRTITAAAVALTNVNVSDVTGAGAAAPFTGTSMGNCLGNSGITFDSPATQTHTASVGGNWSDVTKWTSRVPLPQDNVVVDVNTTGTLTMDMPQLGADITFAGFSGTANATIAQEMFGSMTLGAGMTYTGAVVLTLRARSSKTITSNNKQFPYVVIVGGPGGVYTLADACSCLADMSFQAASTFTTASFALTARSISFSATGGTPALNLGSSTVTLTDAGAVTYVFAFSGTFNAGTSNIVLSSAYSGARSFLLSSQTFSTITYTVAGSTGALVFVNAFGASTIGTLNFSDVTNARTLTLPSGITTTVTTLNVNGTAGKLMIINSSTPGTAATISKASGGVANDYLSLQDITAAGGAVFYAGAHSTNVSGNTGWNFQKLASPTGGNWSATTAWVGGVVPTAADAVVLDSASGNVTIDTGAVARALDCTGYTGTLTHTAGLILGNDAVAGPGNVALKLVSGMTYILTNPITSSIFYNSTSATQQTITTGGKTLGNWSLNGTGASYILGDANTVGTTSTVSLAAGTLSTGNFACSWGLFLLPGTVAKTLTLGSSAIAITGSSSTAVNVTGSNIVFTANTAVVTFTSTGSAGILSSNNWNGTSLAWTNAFDARIINGPTVNNVTVTGLANKADVFQIQSANPTITGTLTVASNSSVNRILMRSDIVGTTRAVTVGAGFSFTNVDFQDVTAAGAAGAWTGTSMGNALGNSNITFDPSTTQTHTASVGGNWGDVTKWTSRVPLPQDAVIVDSNTTGTLTLDMPRLGADVNFTGFAGTLSATINQVIYGSVTLGAALASYTGGNSLFLQGRSSKTITSNGKQFTGTIIVNGPGGTYTLTDALTIAGGLSCQASSTFTTDGFSVSILSFSSGVTGGIPTINLGASTVTLNDTTNASTWIFSLGASSMVVSAASATLVVANASTVTRRLLLQGKSFGTVTYTVAGSTGALEFSSAATVGTLNFSDASNARSLLFTAGTTTTVTNFNVFGGPGRLVTIDSVTAATHTLSKASGTVSGDYLSVKNSIATGGASWYAGTNSTNAGGNTGWIFTALPTVVPLSGDGSLTIGGAPSVVAGVALSGTGALSGLGTPLVTGASLLSGTGTLTGVGAPQALVTVDFAGAGTLTATGAPAVVESPYLTGVGSLSMTGTPAIAGPIGLSGSGSLAGGGSAVIAGLVALNALGTLSTTGTPMLFVAPVLAGSGQLGVTAVSWLAPISLASARWQVRSIVSTAVGARWQVRQLVVVSAVSRWSVQAQVGSTATSRWNVRALVLAGAAARWDVRLQVGVTASGTWNVAMLPAPDVRHPQLHVLSSGCAIRVTSAGCTVAVRSDPCLVGVD